MSVKQLIDIDELREDFQKGKVTCYGMTIQEIMNLKKENEELKKENEELKKELERWKERCAEIYWEG